MTRRFRTRRLMTLPMLALAALAATTALLKLAEPPSWLAWLPPWASAVLIAVSGVVVAWWTKPLADRRLEQTKQERQSLELLRSHLGRQDRLPRIGEAGAQALALRVHPGLAAPDRQRRARALKHKRWPGHRPEDEGGDREPPLFVERGKSGEVRAWMREHRDTGGFLLLVGDSCVGKTRLLYESACRELGDYAVLAPDLGHGDLINTTAQATFRLPKLVVWLDELQTFLQGPYIAESAITAGAVRRLLDAPTPVIVLGTLWPTYARDLRASGPEPTTGQDRPLYPGAVEILSDGRVTEVSLKTFSETERAHATELAAQDPRLARALADRDYNVTEALAGAPELMHRYERATEEQEAVIHAAVDARRLGIQAPLSYRLLCEAARGYLTTLHPDDTWLTPAIQELTSATRPQDRATAPLIPILNDQRAEVIGYTVADYLLQHLTRRRRTNRLSDTTWQALIDHSHRADDQALLADAAARRLLYRYSKPLRRRLADAGDKEAMDARADSMIEQGRIKELRALADAGGFRAAYWLADQLVQQGRADEAIEMWRRQVDAGHGGRDMLARLLVKQGRADEAIEMWRRHGDSVGLVLLLRELGRVEELRELADAGNSSAAEKLRDLLIEGGNVDAAVQVERQLTATGDRHGSFELPRLLLKQGRVDELRQLADAGHSYAESELAGLLSEQGRVEELRELADAGRFSAQLKLTSLLAEQGRVEELRKRADSGQWGAAWRLADVLVERGRVDEAVAVLRDRVVAMGDPQTPSGDNNAYQKLVMLLEQEGRVDELGALADLEIRNAPILTEQLERVGLTGDIQFAALRLSRLLQDHGRAEELRTRADAGDRHAAEKLNSLLLYEDRLEELRARSSHDAHAARMLAGQLREQGQIDDAVQVLNQHVNQYLTPVGLDAVERDLVSMLVEHSRIDDLRREVQAGTQGAASGLVRALAAEGTTADEAERTGRLGLNPDGSIADEATAERD